MTIEFKFRGTDPSHFGRAIAAQATRELERQLQAKIRGVTCPVHRRPPKITLVHIGGKLKSKVTACCTKFERSIDVQLR